MIKLLNEEMAISSIDENYIIIVPSKDEVYYKKKFLSKNYNVFTINSFIISKYDGALTIANDNQNFLFMYKAYIQVKNKLIRYNDVHNLSFIEDLLSTYEDFYDEELQDNDKVSDLKIIFDTYESLLVKEGLINRKLLFKEVLDNSKFDLKYAFLNVEKLTRKEYQLIGKIGKDKDVIVSVDGFDEVLINNIKKISKDISYPYEINSNINKKISFFALNDIEEELQYILNDISKKVINGSMYKDFIIVCKDVNLYEPYFSYVFDFPYSKNSYLGILTSRFIKIFTNIMRGDFSCENFINLLKLDIFDINLSTLDKLDNYVYEWNLENENFYIPFASGTNDLLLDELNGLREDIVNQIRYFLENIVGQNNIKVILKEFWTYLSESKIDEKLFEKDPEGYNNLVLLSENINDYFNNDITPENFFDLLNQLTKKICIRNEFLDEVTISNIKDASYENKKYIYLIGADLDFLSGTFKPSKLLENSDLKNDVLINKINEFSSYEKALFNRVLKNDNFMISYHKLSPDLSLKTPSTYLYGDVCKVDGKLYNKKLIMYNYASLLSYGKINPVKVNDEVISKINNSYCHNLNFKITKDSAKKLYSKHLICSPSSIETYCKCRFYHFCQYGLKLKVKEKKLFDNREVGSLVHFVLENVIKNDSKDINITNLESKVTYYAFKYLSDNNKLVNNITKYVVKTIVKSTVMIIKNMINEREISKFKPKYFEFKINDNSIIKPICVDFNEGKMTINGVVDRIDVYETDNKYYYLVVDYKTGTKKLRLDDILAGLNLQMLLYILAFKESVFKITNKEPVISAVLYYPALIKKENVSRGLSEEEIKESISKRLLADGIINKDKDVLEALGSQMIGNYIGVISRGKLDDEKIFGVSDLDILFDGIKRTLKEVGENILNGNIEAIPVKGRVDACCFCKFNSICGFDKESDSVRRLKNYKNSEVIKLLEGDYNA